MKKILNLIVCAALVLGLTVPALASATSSQTGDPGMQNFAALIRQAGTAPQFSDVDTGAWYGDKNEGVLSKAAAYGLMIGDGSLFAPEGSVTLAEAVTMAARLHSIYATGKAEFTEGDPWHKVYVDYCDKEGILFAANLRATQDMSAAATREQYGRLMTAALPSAAFAVINTVDYSAIPDVPVEGAGGDYAYLLYRAGIVEGRDGGKYCPRDPISRAESAALVVRIVDPAARRSFTLTKGSGSVESDDLKSVVLLARQAIDAAKTSLTAAGKSFATSYPDAAAQLEQAESMARLCLQNCEKAQTLDGGTYKADLQDAYSHCRETVLLIQSMRSGVAAVVTDPTGQTATLFLANRDTIFKNAVTYVDNVTLFLARVYNAL